MYILKYLIALTLGIVCYDIVSVQGFTGCVSLIATHGPLGIIFSHSDPDKYGVENYANNYDICWSISTTDADHIKVTNEGFELQAISGSTCLDYVAIYQDDTKNATDLVGKYCGTSFNTYTSPGQKILIDFHTDGSVTAPGFKIDFTGEYNSEVNTVNAGQVAGFTILSVAVVVIGVIMMIMCVTAHYNKQRHVHVEHNHPEDGKHRHFHHHKDRAGSSKPKDEH